MLATLGVVMSLHNVFHGNGFVIMTKIAMTTVMSLQIYAKIGGNVVETLLPLMVYLHHHPTLINTHTIQIVSITSLSPQMFS